MDSFTKHCSSLHFQKLFLLCCALIFPVSASVLISDYNTLVYNKCLHSTAESSVSPLIWSLHQELAAQSAKSGFFETYAGDDKISISGLFQCRGDLSMDACRRCVHRLQKLSSTLCRHKGPARIQLSGCYLHYKADGLASFGHELIHKSCSESKVTRSGFEEVRDKAFEEAGKGVMAGNGFCDMKFESVRVMAQCEGSLGGCDCGECVSNALQIAQDECGYAVSGEVFLDNCFINYSYNQEKGSRHTSGKLVAIVVGGIIALSIGLLCLYFIKSRRKIDDDW